MTIDVIHTGPLGVNTYVVPLNGPDVFIVDCGACKMCGDENEVTRFLAEKKLNPVAVVQTHGHFDHVAGLSHLADCYPNIQIAIHKNDAAFIGHNSGVLQSESLYEMSFEGFIPAVSNLPEPTSFLADGKTLAECLSSDSFRSGTKDALGEWSVIYTPGHSPGSVCIYNKKNGVLVSGDTLFYHSYGRTDLPGGDEVLMQQSLHTLDKIIPRGTLIYPGHDSYGFKF